MWAKAARVQTRSASCKIVRGARDEGRITIVVGAARGSAPESPSDSSRKASVVSGHRGGAGKATAARRGGTAPRFVHADIGTNHGAEAIVAATLERFGRVDILVQNAGIFPWTLIENIAPDEWDRVLAVNLKGTFLAAQACLKPMKAQRYGRMVFTSSITGPKGQPGLVTNRHRKAASRVNKGGGVEFEGQASQ